MSRKYDHVILNTSRWETETIVEWIEYYRAIRFDHIYIYCNDDDPEPFYSKIRHYVECPEPFVTFHYMPYQGQQASCWVHFLQHHKHECEWFMFADADEFLALKNCNDIKNFMSGRDEKFDCIHFNWIWFGPQNYEERPEGSTLLNFTRREDECVQMNYFTKTINRSSSIDAGLLSAPPPGMINHRWPSAISATLRQANVLDEDMSEFFQNFPVSAEEFMDSRERRSRIIDTACIYHYLFRSKNDFKRRIARGLRGDYYFQKMWGDLSNNLSEFDRFLSAINAKEDFYLRDFWQTMGSYVRKEAYRHSIVPLAPSENIAIGGYATQSSICEWSAGRTVSDDAKGAISGQVTGSDGFHTDIEETPWWMLDLGQTSDIGQIRVFNSLKSVSFAARAFPLIVETSIDRENWKLEFDNVENSPFGGADGHPLIIMLTSHARYVRLSLKTRDYFHLDEVEIYQ